MTYDPHSEDIVPVEPAAEPTAPMPSATPKPVKVDRVRWGLLSSLLLLVAIMVLAFQNPQLTEITFLAWTTPEVPVSIVIIGSAVVAIIVDELFGIFWRLRRRRRRRAAEKAAS